MLVLRDSLIRLGKIWSYGWLLAEVMLAIIIAQLTVKLVPFRHYGKWLYSLDGDDEAPSLLTARLRLVIDLACRILPWNPLCLPRAIAAKAVLARRGYASVLTLGVADQGGALRAHAWLTANNVIVSGRSGMLGFQKVADFGKRLQP